MATKSGHHFGVATNASGVPISNASVQVYLAGTTSAPPLFSNEARTTSLSNPFSANSDGFFEFYTVPGIALRIQVSAPGATTRDVDNIQSLVPLVSGQVVGLTASSNANETETLNADSVTLFNPNTQMPFVRRSTGNIAINIDTAGPAAGGRDQAAAFSNSSWVHFYFIWTGGAGGAEGTLSGIASANAPPTGPTLPTGYTHWCYATTVRINNVGDLRDLRSSGAWVWERDVQTALQDGTATSETSVTLTDFLPPNARGFTIGVRYLGVTSDGGGDYQTRLELFHTPGSVFSQFSMSGKTSASIGTFVPVGIVAFPGTTLSYRHVTTTGSGATTTFDFLGYRVPNGGE
jgi:hypothetical protein